MQFSDTSNLTGLVEDMDFLCGSNATSFPLKDKARLANRWGYKALIDYIIAQKKFQVDDRNLTDRGPFDTDLVNGQSDYERASTHLRVHAVEVMDSSGVFHRLEPIDLESSGRSISEFENTTGLPRYYDVRGSSLILRPAPAAASVTLSGGLRQFVSREFDPFTSTDTTQEPGFIPEPFHRICSLGPSYDWLMVNGPSERRDAVRAELEQLRAEFRKFVSNMNEEVKVAIRPAHRVSDYI